ncbi:MAG: RDD family protein [Planctomycetota bacterium]
MRQARRFVVLLLCVLSAAIARADGVAAFAASERGGGGHAWLLVDRADGSSRLVHLPPVRGANAARPGTVRLGLDLAERPASIAATGERVAFLFAGADQRPAKVAVTRVIATAGGTWAMLPQGRLETIATLPADVAAVSIAADAEGFVLLGDPGEPLRAWRMDEQGSIAPIAGIGENRRDGRVIGAESWMPAVSGSGAAVLVEGAQGWTLHRMRANAWEAGQTIAGPRPLRAIDLGALLLVERDLGGGEREVASVGNSGSLRLGAWDADSIIGAMDDGRAGLLLALASSDDGSDRGVASVSYALEVIDAAGGTPLFSGPPRPQQIVSPGEFRLLVLVLIVVMGAALLVAIRPDPNDGVVVLPAGWALAEPGRRVAATLIDGLLAAFIASLATGAGLFDVVSGLALIRAGDVWVAVPLALAIACGLSALGELIGGRSVGKVVTGCRVVRVGPALREDWARVGWWGAIARNVVKWWLPPVALLGLLETNRRHRGDGMASTAVVIPIGLGDADEPGDR